MTADIIPIARTPTPVPNMADISGHLANLFAPGFVHAFPDASIEIAYGRPDAGPNKAKPFSAFAPEAAAQFAAEKNAAGNNVYVGAALRNAEWQVYGDDKGEYGRSNGNDHFLASQYAWIDYDKEGDHERVTLICEQKQLKPAMRVTTGTFPHRRAHLYFKIAGGVTDAAKLKAANSALRDLFGTDPAVTDFIRVLRLAGTTSYPSSKKAADGYTTETTTLDALSDPETYSLDDLCALAATASSTPTSHLDYYEQLAAEPGVKRGKSEDELLALLTDSRATPGKGWREPILKFIGSTVGKGWSDFQIKLACAPYSDGGINDADVKKEIDYARKKFGKPGPDQSPEPAKAQGPLIVSSRAFLDGFIPPDYLIDGILQRRFIYSLTAPTGSGKTAVALMLAAHVALGRGIGEMFVEQGRVLYLAGENPDDIRMRWLANAEKLGFDPADIDVHFLAGTVKLSMVRKRIRDEVEAIGPVALVVIDTSAAYFEGDDENGNVQMGNHARLLRELVTLPGEPCVVVACHPVKNAVGDASMLPRGGGAFIAEMDGNLTCSKEESTVKLHWTGKFRGPDFAPMHFGLHTATADALKDSRGRPIPTVVAVPISEFEQQQSDEQTRGDDDAILKLLSDGDTRSLADIATRLFWRTSSGQPNKSKAQRAGKRLKLAKLVELGTRGMALTPKGKKEANRLTPQVDATIIRPTRWLLEPEPAANAPQEKEAIRPDTIPKF